MHVAGTLQLIFSKLLLFLFMCLPFLWTDVWWMYIFGLVRKPFRRLLAGQWASTVSIEKDSVNSFWSLLILTIKCLVSVGNMQLHNTASVNWFLRVHHRGMFASYLPVMRLLQLQESVHGYSFKCSTICHPPCLLSFPPECWPACVSASPGIMDFSFTFIRPKITIILIFSCDLLSHIFFVI